MTTCLKLALNRTFTVRDKQRVWVESETANLADFVLVCDPNGVACYGFVEEVQFRAIELPRRWIWTRRRKVFQRRVKVRFRYLGMTAPRDPGKS